MSARAFNEITWSLDEDHTHFVLVYKINNKKINLSIEAMPDKGWDWLIWNGNASEEILYGMELSFKRAVQAAERALASVLLRNTSEIVPMAAKLCKMASNSNLHVSELTSTP